MNLHDIVYSAWALQPEILNEIMRIYNAHVSGDKIDLEMVEKKIGKPLANEQEHYEIIDGVAVIPIYGVIAKRMNMFFNISGGSSTQMLAEDISEALANPEVHSLVLDIDSPGGTVDGVQALAKLIYESRGIKPIVALADGLMASGAVWIGTSAERVYVADNTTQVGSIGVVTSHTDRSKSQEMIGVKTTEIYAGKYKRIASSYEPLSSEGKEYIQDMVDNLYGIFLGDVARNRGVSIETTHENMGDGLLFVGEQAVGAGLVDGIMSLGELIKTLNIKVAENKSITNHNRGIATMADNNAVTAVAPVITLESIQAKHPGIASALIAQGAEAERARIVAVESQTLPGHEALIAKLKFDGITSGPEAAVAVLSAEKKNHAKTLVTLETEAPKPVALSVETDEIYAGSPEDQAKRKWDKDSKLRTEFGGNFEAFKAYEEATRTGMARICAK